MNSYFLRAISSGFAGILVSTSLCATRAQTKNPGLEWKFSASSKVATKEKSSNLTFYSLEQGAIAAFKETEGITGAVVVLPGARLNEEERRNTARRGIDPDRMLTAIAVALVLPLADDTSQAFVSKEDWKNVSVYRWKT